MQFSMLYSGEQILSFKSCLVFYAGDSLSLKFYFDNKDELISTFYTFENTIFSKGI